MDIKSLRYFLEVATLGSFTKASATLHVAQSALSVSLRKLEEELGVPLLARRARRVAPTAEGQLLLVHVHRVLQEVDAARRAIDDAVEIRVGEVRIGLPPMFGLPYVSSLVSRFHARYPDVQITALEGSADEVAAMLEGGEIDIAVLESRRVHGDWARVGIGDEELVLCVSPKNSLAKCKAVSGRMLDGVAMALFTETFIQRDIVERICKAAGAKPRVVIQSNFVPLVMKAAIDDIGAVTLLRSIAAPMEDLVALSFDPPERLSFVLCWLGDRYLSKANRAFIDCANERE